MLENLHIQNFRHKRSKAFTHTWPAWQSEPGHSLRKAFQTNVLDISLPNTKLFVAWLNRLFNR